MNGNSKVEKIDAFVRRIVRDEMARITFWEVARSNMGDAQTLARFSERIAIGVAAEVTATYSMLELKDIMEWRKRKAEP